MFWLLVIRGAEAGVTWCWAGVGSRMAGCWHRIGPGAGAVGSKGEKKKKKKKKNSTPPRNTAVRLEEWWCMRLGWVTWRVTYP